MLQVAKVEQMRVLMLLVAKVVEGTDLLMLLTAKVMTG